MRKGFTYKEVKNFIEVKSGSGCQLLSREYRLANEKLLIQCKCGESFEKRYNDFKNDNQRQCNKCNSLQRKAEKYKKIKEHVEIRSDSGCKLLSEEYEGIKYKMLFQCRCGREFKTSYDEFKHLNKRQCNKCGKIKQSKSRRLPYLEVKRFIEGEKGNGCKLISEEYKNNSTQITIQCKCGEKFKATFGKFQSQNKKQCDSCGMESKKVKLRKTHEEFVNEIYNLVGKDFTVLGRYKSSQINIKMKCNVCGAVWYPRPNDVIQGTRCPGCTNSKGEQEIARYLRNSNIDYISEYTFDDCRNQLPLPFDFYLPRHNLLIEYDGEGHYEPFRFSEDKQKMLNKLKQQQKHDDIKNQYCKDNNIPLLRIPYWEFDNIEQILEEWLIEHGVELEQAS